MTHCEEIARGLGALFECSPMDSRTRIRTPFLYPDGDVIDLFLSEKNGTVTLTDLGESMRWLRTQTASAKKSPKQRQMIDDVCVSLGVELYRGMLTRRILPGENLAEVVTLVAQAALRVSDLWFTFRNRAVQSVTDEIADFLTERAISFDRSQKLQGRSGRGYTIDFHTRTPVRSAFVQVLATGSRASAKGVTEHVVTMWHDLNHLRAMADAAHFVSLFDDTADVWSDEDFRLLDTLSEIARWSRPDDVEALLKAA